MPKGAYCPLIRKNCIEGRCKFWVHVRGKDPQSSAELDLEDCAVKWLPTLLIEVSQMERQTGAAVESTRNEQARGFNALANAVLSSPPNRILEVKP